MVPVHHRYKIKEINSVNNQDYVYCTGGASQILSEQALLIEIYTYGIEAPQELLSSNYFINNRKLRWSYEDTGL